MKGRDIIMPIPKLKSPMYTPSEKDLRIHQIVYSLRDMGYNADDARSAIRVIEEYELDKSQFQYPYDSFDEFKKHTLEGEFDIDIQSDLMTKQEQKALDDAVREGKLWVTY